MKRSEQQERMRKQAAWSLMRKRGGWMADFSDYMEAAFGGAMSTVNRSVDGSVDDSKVDS